MKPIAPPAHAHKSRHRRPDSRLRLVENHPVFIAYDIIPSARHALAQLNTMLRARPGCVLQPMFWRLDQLTAPRWREMSLADAARAANVVIALDEGFAWDTATETWLSALALRQQGAAITVLALIGDAAWTIALQKNAQSPAQPPAFATQEPLMQSTPAARPEGTLSSCMT